MGLIGTRSLDTQIPGINELVKSAEGNIRNGIDAYDALQTIRKARTDAEIPAEARCALRTMAPTWATPCC
jgi:cytochrome d ubiquinol oxidase subunit I